MKKTTDATRRDFLKSCVAGAVALGAGEMAIAKSAVHEAAAAKSKVIVARDANLTNGGASLDSTRVQKLLDRAMQSFFDTNDPVTPWKKLVRPGEVVGLKVNTIAGPGLSTNLELIKAVCERLKQAGVKPGNIVVWDRWNREFERVKYPISTDANRERFMGTDTRDFGYEDETLTSGTVSTRLSKLLTRTCDCMINLPVMKDHVGSGITCAMKNMYGVIENPYKLHDNNCSPYIADLYMLPAIRNKFRLSICDAFTASFEGGPSYHPQYTWKFNGLVVASDPVANDCTVWQIIERKRAEMGLKSLADVGRPATYIAVAADAQHRLGTNDPKRIAVMEI